MSYSMRERKLEKLLKEACERVEFLHDRAKTRGLRYEHIQNWLSRPEVKEILEPELKEENGIKVSRDCGA